MGSAYDGTLWGCMEGMVSGREFIVQSLNRGRFSLSVMDLL